MHLSITQTDSDGIALLEFLAIAFGLGRLKISYQSQIRPNDGSQANSATVQ